MSQNAAPAYYIVETRSGRETYFPERDTNETCWSSTIHDLIAGQIEQPVRVFEMIPDEHWSADVTAKVCQEIADWFAAKGDKIDADRQRHLLEWIGQHCGVPAMLALEAA